jgi:hypothetical protein
MALKEPNFRFARQPPTIVTWADLHFYDLPLNPFKWFRKQWAAGAFPIRIGRTAHGS